MKFAIVLSVFIPTLALAQYHPRETPCHSELCQELEDERIATEIARLRYQRRMYQEEENRLENSERIDRLRERAYRQQIDTTQINNGISIANQILNTITRYGN